MAESAPSALRHFFVSIGFHVRGSGHDGRRKVSEQIRTSRGPMSIGKRGPRCAAGLQERGQSEASADSPCKIGNSGGWDNSPQSSMIRALGFQRPFFSSKVFHDASPIHRFVVIDDVLVFGVR